MTGRRLDPKGRRHTANPPKGGQPNNALAAQALGALESWQHQNRTRAVEPRQLPVIPQPVEQNFQVGEGLECDSRLPTERRKTGTRDQRESTKLNGIGDRRWNKRYRRSLQKSRFGELQQRLHYWAATSVNWSGSEIR